MSMTRRAAIGGTVALAAATLAAPSASAQAPAPAPRAKAPAPRPQSPAPRAQAPAPPAQAPAPAPTAPTVYFINLKNGATVKSPFKVQFGLTGMGVAPAGMEKDKTGHHHLLVDTTLSAADQKSPLPVDANHLHFGGGQTEAMVTLPAGQHTLQLVFANWSHIPFDPPIVSPVIRITVK